MTATEEAVQLQNLLALPDDTFHTLIEKSLDRDERPALWDLLLHPRMVHRTHGRLSGAFRDVEDQLAQRRADMDSYRQECFSQGDAGKQDWFAAWGEYQEWRRRAIGYRRILQKRLTDSKNALRGVTTPPRPRQRQPPPVANPGRKIRQMETVFRLAWAISEHRTETLAQGIVPDEHDVELWRALDLIEVDTTDGPITITQFLDDITSKPGFEPPDLMAGGRS